MIERALMKKARRRLEVRFVLRLLCILTVYTLCNIPLSNVRLLSTLRHCLQREGSEKMRLYERRLREPEVWYTACCSRHQIYWRFKRFLNASIQQRNKMMRIGKKRKGSSNESTIRKWLRRNEPTAFKSRANSLSCCCYLPVLVSICSLRNIR